MSKMILNEFLTVFKKSKQEAILNMLHWNILFLMLSYNQVTPSFISFNDLKNLTNSALEVHGKYQKVNDIHGTHTRLGNITLSDVFESAREISRKVVELENKIELQIDDVQMILQDLPSDKLVNRKKYDVSNALIEVNVLFDYFMAYTNHYDEGIANSTLEIFMEVVIPYGDSLQIFIADGDGEFSRSLSSLLRKTEIIELELCDSIAVPQETLFQVYARIVAMQIKSFIMLNFAYALGIYQKKKYQASLENSRKDFIERSQEITAAIKAVMREMPRSIRRCDPQNFIRGHNYLDLAGFIQGWIANEDQLNPDRSCTATCSTIENPMPADCWTDDNRGCASNYCFGTVHDCVDGGSGEWRTCPESFSPRRYSYFVDGNGKLNGEEEKEKCRSQEETFQWYSYQLFYRCDYCVCICVEDKLDSSIVHAISLRPQVSNISENRVLIGVRFVERNEFIHLQIKQAVLQAEGRIDNDTESWKELEEFVPIRELSAIVDYDYYESDSEDNSDPSKELKHKAPEYGTDFTLLKFNQRRIHLDDLLAPKNHIVTGIRFQHRIIPAGDKSEPIEIAIRITPFDYTSGKLLLPAEERWITARDMANSSKDYRKQRTEFNMNDNVGKPTRSALNLPDSKPNSYIEFRASGFKEDAAQSTIPFLDSQPVHGKPSFPIGGVGLFHKGSKGSGGFLALKIFTIDLSEYMD